MDGYVVEYSYNTAMTAIVGMKYDGGILMKSDSLNLEQNPKSKTPHKIRRLVYQDKIYRLTKHVVVGFAANHLYETHRLMILATLKQLFEAKSSLSVEENLEIAQMGCFEVVRGGIKEQKQGIIIKLLVAAYDVSISPPRPKLFRVVIEEDNISVGEMPNYVSIGSEVVTNQIADNFREEGYDIERNLYNKKQVDNVINATLKKCSEYEKNCIQKGVESSVHVGGAIKSWRITPKQGAKQLSDGEVLETYVKRSDNLLD
jgi:20S proteasome alpha/beta subunit